MLKIEICIHNLTFYILAQYVNFIGYQNTCCMTNDALTTTTPTTTTVQACAQLCMTYQWCRSIDWCFNSACHMKAWRGADLTPPWPTPNPLYPNGRIPPGSYQLGTCASPCMHYEGD